MWMYATFCMWCECMWYVYVWCVVCMWCLRMWCVCNVCVCDVCVYDVCDVMYAVCISIMLFIFLSILLVYRYIFILYIMYLFSFYFILFYFIGWRAIVKYGDTWNIFIIIIIVIKHNKVACESAVLQLQPVKCHWPSRQNRWKLTLEEGVFVESAFNMRCHKVKNTLLHIAFLQFCRLGTQDVIQQCICLLWVTYYHLWIVDYLIRYTKIQKRKYPKIHRYLQLEDLLHPNRK